MTTYQLQALATVVKYGGLKEAAVSLGISVHSLRHLLSKVRKELDAHTTCQAAWLLGRNKEFQEYVGEKSGWYTSC